MNEVPEDIVIQALEFAHKESQPIISCIEELHKEIGKEKITYVVKKLEEEVEREVEKIASEEVEKIIKLAAQKKAPENAIDYIKNVVFMALPNVDKNTAVK